MSNRKIHKTFNFSTENFSENAIVQTSVIQRTKIFTGRKTSTQL